MYVAIDLANTHVHCIIMSVIDNTVIGNILVYTTAIAHTLVHTLKVLCK